MSAQRGSGAVPQHGRSAVLGGAEPFSHDGDDLGVLVCHGFTGTPQSVRPLARAVADAGHTVRLPRLPGHGTTWEDLAGTGWEDWYGHVEAALEEMRGRCRRVVVAGLSMGGALAALLAADHPGPVAGLVLVNPAFRIDDRRLLALPLLRRLVPSIPGIGDDIARVGGERELCYDRVPLAALASQTRLWRLATSRLPAVTQPTLLMRSRVDHVVPASSAAVVRARVAGPVTDVVLHDSHHVATLDHDADFVGRACVDFAERVAAPEGAS